jgi:hypothetical protein
MPTFIDGHGGRRGSSPKINLDLVARLEPTNTDPDSYDCYDAEGRDVGRVFVWDIPKATAAIAPESKGAVVVSFSRDGHTRYPVLAWRVGVNGIGTPVLYVELPAIWCIETQIGDEVSWVFPTDNNPRFNEFVKAEAHALKLLQRDTLSHELALVGGTRG